MSSPTPSRRPRFIPFITLLAALPLAALAQPAPNRPGPDRPPGPPGPGQKMILGGPGQRAPLTEHEGIAAPGNEPELAVAVQTFADRLHAADKFAGTILVAKADGPVFSGAWGLADRGNGRANTIETAYDVASIGKLFTQIAVLQLVEEGKLSLEDKVGRHLPAYPNRDVAEKATVRHLLAHTSGLGPIFRFITPGTNIVARTELAQLLELFAADPLEFEPGTGNAYSNAGYVVLGLIIEAVTGRNYYDHVTERVIRAAGLKDTGFFLRTQLPAHVARGYQGGNDVTEMHPGRGSPAGGLQATAPDLVRLIAAVNDGRLLRPESVRVLATEVYPPNPYSAKAAEAGRIAAMGFAGGAPGASAITVVSRDGRYVTVILANNTGGIAEDIWPVLRGWINGLP